MAKMNKKELERIIAKDLPGYRVSPQSKVERASETSERSCGLADTARSGGSDRISELRRKYLGSAAEEDDAVDSNPGHNDDSDDDDEEIVAVEPEAANHPWDRSARPKAVVVKNKKIIGVQG